MIFMTRSINPEGQLEL